MAGGQLQEVFGAAFFRRVTCGEKGAFAGFVWIGGAGTLNDSEAATTW
jgi:hypothetical protein